MSPAISVTPHPEPSTQATASMTVEGNGSAAAFPAKDVWAVLVVHGVGDTGPGITVDALLPTLATVNLNLLPDGIQEVRWLSEPGATDLLKPFPVHVRRATVGTPREDDPHTATFAEVYWADLSRIRATIVDLLFALVSLVFLIRFVTDQAVAIDQPKGLPRWATQWMRLLLYCTGWILIGPIAAQTALLTLFVAIGFSLEAVLPGVGGLGGLLCVAATALGLIFAIVSWRRDWDSTWKVLVHCFTVLAGYATLRAWISGLTIDLTAANLFVTLVILYRVLGVLSAFSLIAGLLAISCPRSLCRQGLWAALATMSLQVGIWVLMVPLLILVILGRLPTDIARHVRKFLSPVWEELSIHLVCLILIGLAALAVQLRRMFWNRRNASKDLLEAHAGKPSRVIPRLLVSGWLVGALLLLYVLGYAGYWIALGASKLGIPDDLLQSVALKVVPVAAIVVPILFVSLSEGIRAGLHILLDVTNHFYRRTERVPWPGKDLVPTSDVIREFDTQQRLEARFRLVLQELLLDKAVTHLTIVAHSQGTMIAVNALNSLLVRELLHREGRPLTTYLVTMGSPLTHIYQYYFPFRYPPLPDPPFDPLPDPLPPKYETWLLLPHMVKKWLNVYRLDDFVGTYVAPEDDSYTRIDDEETAWLVNLPVPRGGHMGYWRQRAVLDHLKKYLPGR